MNKPADATPFGFCQGMTQETTIHKLGKNAIIFTNDPHDVYLNTAIEPAQGIEMYGLTFSPNNGLVAIQIYTPFTIKDSYGDQTRLAYKHFKEILTRKYGNPSYGNEDLKQGSIWDQPSEWMMGLFQNQRSLASFWDPPQNVSNLEEIHLVTIANSNESARICVAYQFTGFNAFSKFRDDIQADKF